MERLAVILIFSTLLQLATKCSSQLLGASLAGNRGTLNSASADPGWLPSGYGVRGGSGLSSMPIDPLMSGTYSLPYNSYPQVGSPFMSSPNLGLPISGVGVPSPSVGLPPSGMGSPVSYGGFNSPFGIGLPSSGIPYSPVGSGMGFNEPNALTIGGPSSLAFQQPAYAMPIMAQPQTTQMTENDNANTNININHDMGVHHPSMPKGLLGLARM